MSSYRYGRHIDWSFSTTNVTHQSAAVLHFDVSAVLHRKVTRVRLIQHVSNINNHIRTSNFSAIEVTSGAINIELRATWNNIDTITRRRRTVNIAEWLLIGATPTHISDVNITAIFDRDFVQGNIFSIRIGETSNTEDTPFNIYHSREHNPAHPHLIIDIEDVPPLAPTNLLPDTTRNPTSPITFSWRHTPNPESPVDPQTASELTVWQDGVAARVFTVQGNVNEIVLPANTFTIHRPVHFRVRTQTQYNGWGAASATVTFPLEITPPLAPTSLLPNSTRNPKAPITFSWWHTPNPESPVDPQTASELTVWQDGVAARVFTVQGDVNEIVLPADIFTLYRPVHFRVRTQAQHNGWGVASATGTFPLEATPPRAPALIFPINISVTGTNGVHLEWSYNSPYDTFPSRFDIEYRIDGGSWATITNRSQGTTPARTTALTRTINAQTRVDWRVMAYGEVGDMGPWSETATFFTIGAPRPPTIVSVTNADRPIINFSATNIMSWEIEIWQNNSRIYETGNNPFVGEFRHISNQFFANGNYITRMRVTNEFGIESEWAELPFTIHTAPPEALTLKITNNLRHFIRLWFNNTSGNTVYIYRSVWQADSFMRIGKTTGDTYKDYSAAPGVRYEYFIRAVSGNFSFADSKRHTGLAIFDETTFAGYDSLHNMLFLEYQAGGIPTKDATFDAEKSLTRFEGREMPVLQAGRHNSNSIALSFYCSRATYEQLKTLATSDKVLLMRDKQHGSIFGTIYGSISTRRREALDGFVVSFTFVEVDYNQEVDIR